MLQSSCQNIKLPLANSDRISGQAFRGKLQSVENNLKIFYKYIKINIRLCGWNSCGMIENLKGEIFDLFNKFY